MALPSLEAKVLNNQGHFVEYLAPVQGVQETLNRTNSDKEFKFKQGKFYHTNSTITLTLTPSKNGFRAISNFGFYLPDDINSNFFQRTYAEKTCQAPNLRRTFSKTL